MERLRPDPDHGILEVDNSASGRGVRAMALGRKNNRFVRSEAAGKSATIAYTLIAAAKPNGLEPQALLAETLARIPRRQDH